MPKEKEKSHSYTSAKKKHGYRSKHSRAVDEGIQAKHDNPNDWDVKLPINRSDFPEVDTIYGRKWTKEKRFGARKGIASKIYDFKSSHTSKKQAIRKRDRWKKKGFLARIDTMDSTFMENPRYNVYTRKKKK